MTAGRRRPRPPKPSQRRSLALVWSLAAGLVALSIVPAGGAAAAPSSGEQAQVRLAQVLEADRTGVAAPVGLAHSSAATTFYVIDKAVQRAQPATTEVVRLTPGGLNPVTDRAGSERLSRTVDDPVNVAFDERHNRLLMLGSTGELLSVPADGRGGALSPRAVVRWDVSAAGVRQAQGMAVDPASGTLFILDAGDPRMVQLDPAADGSFEDATITAVELGIAGPGSPRGLALEPRNGHWYVTAGTDLIELNPQGDVVTLRELADFNLHDIGGMVFAPSGDQTDAPDQMSLFVADGGVQPGGEAAAVSGQIVELSLAATVAAQAAAFTSVVVNTVDMSAWSPPSIDPSGIAYLPPLDRLMMSDGEVEETVSGITHFQGANVWEYTRSGSVLRTANISSIPPTVVPMTDEPTGVAAKTGTNQYFFTDDGRKRVYTLNAGADGSVGTADDSWTFFSTTGFGSADPEGITYAPTTDRLFVADGVNAEVYQFTLGGALVGQFDVAQYGVTDPESVEFNPVTGTLFTLSDRASGPIVIETTTSGALLQTIDVSAMIRAGGRKPAGLAIAPASDGSGAGRFYVIDRGIDNNSNPSIVDGKMFELTAPGGGPPVNLPPSVNAGPDLTVTLPALGNLDATVTDDGLPNPPGTTTVTWSAISGPGSVTFGDPNAVDTTAAFSAAGTYVLRLTAGDSELSASDDVTVNVNAPGSGSPLYFSLRDTATVGGMTVANEDILFFDGASAFSLYFDGSDVGVSPLRIDGFAVVDPVTLLFSFDADKSVPGIGLVDDSDIVVFTATSLGPTTAGTFAVYFDGSDVGLTASAHDVDAFELLPDGRIAISTLGTATVNGITARDEDMLVFSPTSLGETTGGTFAWYFDGSDVGLGDTAEDVNALTIDARGRIFMSSLDLFGVAGVSGEDEDVFVFTPSSLGSTTAGTYDPVLYFDGSAYGLGANDVFAIELP